MTENRKNIFKQIFFFLTALIFVMYPVWSGFVKGVFRWHVTQPALWHDAVELLIYLIAMLVLSAVAKNRKGTIVLAVSMIYLLSVGTLLQCLVSYVYIEVIIYIGRSFMAIFSKEKKNCSTGVYFLLGSMVWGASAIILSLMRMGAIEELRLLTAALFMLALVNPKNHTTINDIMLVKYVRYLNENKRTEFCINIFFVLVMLISCARVNTHIEFDSSWYALYTDKCLFGDNSFYDFLGYTDFVYYYPKFKELLMAPITGLGLPGYLISANLWIMVICLIEVYHFLIQNIKDSGNQILCVLYLIFSSVCIVGISGTAKSDAISYLYIIMLVVYFAGFLKTKEQTLLGVSLAAGIMSYTVKYTSFLFSTIIFIVIFAVLIYLLLGKRITFNKSVLPGSVFVLLACLVFLGIIYRTYRLTGYPTYREGTGLWEALGFTAKPYFDGVISDKPANVFAPQRILYVLFDIDKAEKIRVQWTGNYTVFMALLLCLYGKRIKNDHKPLFAISAAMALASVGCLVTMAEPDGNYFSVAVIIGTCYFLIRMATSKYWKIYSRWFTAVMGMFMLLNLFFVFVTHPSWVTATRFTEEPVSIFMPEEEKLGRQDKDMELMGIYEINESLKGTDGKTFIIADGSESRLCMLDARVELAFCLFHRYLSGADIDDYQEFLQYINYANAAGFIVARDGSGVEEFGRYVEQYLAEYGCLEQIDTDKYSYYRIK